MSAAAKRKRAEVFTSSCALQEADEEGPSSELRPRNSAHSPSPMAGPSCSQPLPALSSTRRTRRAKRSVPLASPSLRQDSDSDLDFTDQALPVTPGTPAVRELAVQQGTILQLRQENARISQDFATRLSALELRALPPPPASPRPVFHPPSAPSPSQPSAAFAQPLSPLRPPPRPGRVVMSQPTAIPVSTAPTTHLPPAQPTPTHTRPVTPAPATPAYLYAAANRHLLQPSLPPPPASAARHSSIPVTGDLLLESATAFQKPKGTHLFPHQFITRGDSCKKIELGQATMAEYFGAIRRLGAQPSFPVTSFPALLQHEEDLANMAVSWDWQICRRWSEKIFQMVADGRLREGWLDMAPIKDVQRDVCTDAVRAQQARSAQYTPQDLHRAQPSSAQAVSAPSVSAPLNQREDYNKDTDGKPCYPWNWGKECGFQGSHGSSSDALLHICAWCAYKFRRQLKHKEQDCMKKRRFIDKKAASDTSANAVSVSQAICSPLPHPLPITVPTNIHSSTHNVVDVVPESFTCTGTVDTASHAPHTTTKCEVKRKTPVDDGMLTSDSSPIAELQYDISLADSVRVTGRAPSPLNSSLPEVSFDWFTSPQDLPLTLSTEFFPQHPTPPPSPIVFKPILLTFWPLSTDSIWPCAREYQLIYDTVRKIGLPNYLGARITIPSGLHISAWRQLLVGFPDTLLVDHLEYGWPLDYTASVIPTPTTKNHSVTADSDYHICSFINTELKHNALIGPFTSPPFLPWCQLSPIMTRPKKNSSEKRIIIDLSFPPGRSVNAGIKKGYYLGSHFSFSLPSITTLTDRLVKLGSEAWLWAADLARAYRQLRVCPLSTPLLGISVNSQTYIDIAPPFGCRTSALACARTTRALVWLLRKEGFFSLCYLDDFVGIESSFAKASQAYNKFLNLTSTLGLVLALDKCSPPTQSLTWLGFVIDAPAMTVTLPADKIAEVLLECSAWRKKSHASRKQLQSLAGKLHHLSKCIKPATRFTNRVLAAIRASPFSGQHAFSPELHLDLAWFEKFAASYNGIQLLPTITREPWYIECDSTLEGGGAFSPSSYYTVTYPESVLSCSFTIAQLEALNLVHAVTNLLPPLPHNFIIKVNTDNMPSQQVLESGRGKDPILCACARQLWLLAAKFNFELLILHKPGKDLLLADALSRLKDSETTRKKAQALCADLNLSPIIISFSLDILDFDL